MDHRVLFSLQFCTLFKHTSRESLSELLSGINAEQGTFSSHEIIFSPARKADRIGIILSGSVDVQKIFPTGKVIIIERKETYDVIGESSIFSKYEYYTDNVCACSCSEILFIKKSDLLYLFERDRQFLLNFLEAASNSTLTLKHKIGILSLDSIQEKIAGYLIHSLEYENKPGGTTVRLPFSKKAWADYMDVSRPSLCRELKKLETAGILSVLNRTITIQDRSRLNGILSI